VRADSITKEWVRPKADDDPETALMHTSDLSLRTLQVSTLVAVATARHADVARHRQVR
jgi:hypothetical protein